MDFVSILCEIRSGYDWQVNGEGKNYNDIIWRDLRIDKPTLEECQQAWSIISNEKPLRLLRIERNKLLMESDKYMLIDWPHPTEEIKQQWLTYRQQLRDLPSVSTPKLNDIGELDMSSIEWPIKPN